MSQATLHRAWFAMHFLDPRRWRSYQCGQLALWQAQMSNKRRTYQSMYILPAWKWSWTGEVAKDEDWIEGHAHAKYSPAHGYCMVLPHKAYQWRKIQCYCRTDKSGVKIYSLCELTKERRKERGVTPRDRGKKEDAGHLSVLL